MALSLFRGVLLSLVGLLFSVVVYPKGNIEVFSSPSPLWVEHPDGRRVNYSENFYSTVITQLAARGKTTPVEGRGSTVMGSLTILPNTVTFTTGTRGNRDQYGIDGFGRILEAESELDLSQNEFSIPIEDSESKHPFYASFKERGSSLTGSHSGLDLGDGFSLDVLFAFMNIKYTRFRASVGLELQMQHATLPIRKTIAIQSTKKGTFFDFSAGYFRYQGGLQVSRNNAMERSIEKAIEQSVSTIEDRFSEWPWVARIVSFNDPFVFVELSGSGDESIGKVFQTLDGRIALRVIAAPVDSIARATWIRAPNDTSNTQGALFTENHPLTIQYASTLAIQQNSLKSASQAQSDLETLDLEGQSLNLDRLSDRILGEKTTSRFVAALKSIAGFVLLPYRIWRFKHTDQAFKSHADSANRKVPGSRASWMQKNKRTENDLSETDSKITVALLDTGIDYNHPILFDFIDRTHLFWDFSSGDSNPYDDAWRGTVMAASVLDRTAHATLLPIKVFNPWGQTRTRILYQGIVHALKSGAKILVAGWASDRESILSEPISSLLDQYDAILVTTAGNRAANVDRVSYFPTSIENPGVVVTTALTSDLGIYRKSKEGTGYGPNTVDVGVRLPKKWISPLPRGNASKIKDLPDRSAAFVAGAIAERWSVHPTMGRSDVLNDFMKLDTERHNDVRSWVIDGRVLREPSL